jgi:hypothetical protein
VPSVNSGSLAAQDVSINVAVMHTAVNVIFLIH